MITERCPPPDWSDDDEETTEASAVALTERVDCLLVVAATLGAGARVRPQEVSRLRRLCLDMQLPERVTECVLAAARKARAAAYYLDECDNY